MGVHSGHFGIADQIRDMVESCSLCQENRRANTNQPLQPHEVPEYHYQMVGSDLFELSGRSYLLCVGYYIVFLNETKSSDMINELERQFTDFDVPEKLVTDNGPQFGSHEFQLFMKWLSTEHVMSTWPLATHVAMAKQNVTCKP